MEAQGEFVKNAWYVAGWSRDFGEALTRVTITGEALVFYRTRAGEIVALEDRCPHRLLPLSMGKRIGDDIQCGYHGMTFGPDGKCVRIPGQTNRPASAYVTAHPVEERHGIVWVWMGDPEKADRNAIFDMDEFSSPDWQVHLGDKLHLGANYLNVAENLVDPAHVTFVHPTTLGSPAGANVPVHVSTEGEAIVAWRWIRDAEPIGFFKAFGGFTGHVDRWHYYYLHMPSVAVIDFGSAPTEWNLAEEDRQKGVRIFALHLLTPVDEHTTIDNWLHIRNTAIGDDAASEQMDAMFRAAFDEDKIVLEAIEMEEQKPQKRRPIRIAIDKAPNAYRRRIGEMLAAERTEDLAAAPSAAFVYHD